MILSNSVQRGGSIDAPAAWGLAASTSHTCSSITLQSPVKAGD